MSGQPNRIRQTGFSKKTTVPGQDCAIMVCLLQKRSEDAEGNIIAKRVGTVAVNTIARKTGTMELLMR